MYPLIRDVTKKTNSFTLIDGILISDSLKGSIKNVRISYHGDNVSDHFPVELDIDLNVTETDVKNDLLPRYVNWKKLSEEHLTLFRQKMAERLALLRVHSHEFIHGDRCCLDDSHKISLEKYYSDIVSAIIYAESFLLSP